MAKYQRSLEITVRPNSRKETLTESEPGWRATVKRLPIAGQANDRLRRLVSKRFGVPLAQVTIIRGKRSRHKTVGILTPK